MYKRLTSRSPPNFFGTHAVIRTSVQQSSAAAKELTRLTTNFDYYLLVAFFPACLLVRPHWFSSWRQRVLTHLAGVRRLGNHTGQDLAAQILTKGEAWRTAADVVKLPELLRKATIPPESKFVVRSRRRGCIARMASRARLPFSHGRESSSSGNAWGAARRGRALPVVSAGRRSVVTLQPQDGTISWPAAQCSGQ